MFRWMLSQTLDRDTVAREPDSRVPESAAMIPDERDKSVTISPGFVILTCFLE
jgi:hypothetical protein